MVERTETSPDQELQVDIIVSIRENSGSANEQSGNTDPGAQMQDFVVKNWSKALGASEAAIRALQDAAGFELPREYVELLEFSNGGEGVMPDPFGVFCLDRAEDAGNPKQTSLYPGRFVFGGNGGLELFAFDLTGTLPWPVVAFDGADPNGSVRRVAEDFIKFLQLIGSSNIHDG